VTLSWRMMSRYQGAAIASWVRSLDHDTRDIGELLVLQGKRHREARTCGFGVVPDPARGLHPYRETAKSGQIGFDPAVGAARRAT